MNEQDKIYQQIEDYLNGVLEGDQLRSFETMLHSSSDLQKQVNLHRMANDLVIDRKLLEVKDLLKEEQKKYTKRKFRNKLLTLTGLAIISTLGVYLLIPTTENTLVELSSYTPDTALSIDSPLIYKQDSSLIKTTNENKLPVATPTTNSNNRVVDHHLTINTTEPQNEVATIQNKVPEPLIATKKQSEENTVTEPQKVAETIVDPCLKNSPKTIITTENTCMGSDQGKINIRETKGGTAPYRHELYNAQLIPLPIDSDLASGFYTLHTIDKNNCSEYIEAIEIKSKQCPKDYHFNPSLGEEWQLPISNYDGKLTIFNSSGKIAYQNTVNATFDNTWNGVNNNGSVETGYYLFEIHYSNGTVINGSVTIVP